VGRGRQFQAAADHRAVQHGDHRDAGLVDLAEDAMPALRMHHDAGRLAVLVLGEVEAGAEMVAGAGQDHHARFGGTRVPGLFEGVEQAVADGIALGRTAQHDGIDQPVEDDVLRDLSVTAKVILQLDAHSVMPNLKFRLSIQISLSISSEYKCSTGRRGASAPRAG
jgi:hypothetical protein